MYSAPYGRKVLSLCTEKLESGTVYDRFIHPSLVSRRDATSDVSLFGESLVEFVGFMNSFYKYVIAAVLIICIVIKVKNVVHYIY